MLNKFNRKIQKLIGITLIISLIVGRSAVFYPVLALDIPTTPSPVPTTAPVAIEPTSPPASREPTSAPVPTTHPAPREPTSAPVPTTPPAQRDPPTGVPSPTTSPLAIGETPTIPPTSTPTPPNTNGNTNITGDSGSSGPTGATGSDRKVSDETANDPKNSLTGPGSTNAATENNSSDTSTSNSNNADVLNKISGLASSGFNTANLNTLSGNVLSGDSYSTLTVLNKLNSNFAGLGGVATFNIYDDHKGDITFTMADNNAKGNFASSTPTVSANSVTGSNSTNIADANSKVVVNEANGNNAKLTNDVNLTSSTGSNAASYNTGNGDVKTGKATAWGNILNFANTNLNVDQWLIGIVNIFGNLTGNIILPHDTTTASTNTGNTAASNVSNDTTGPNSTNISKAGNSQSNNSSNTNTANITSNLDVSANSGNNTAGVNTGGGTVKTGGTEVDLNKTTVANTNASGDTVWLVIVNQLGKWVGYIVGAPWGAKTAASSNVNTSNQSSGSGNGNNSSNSLTGPNSYNESNVNGSSDTTNVSTNNAEIINNVKVNADTGNNDASYNTGFGNVVTGDAKAGLNLVDFVNTNVVAKKFVTVLVNVFGTFTGEVIPPDQSVTTTASVSVPDSHGTVKAGNGSNDKPIPTPTMITAEASSTSPSDTSRTGGTAAFENLSANNESNVQMVSQSKTTSSVAPSVSEGESSSTTNKSGASLNTWTTDYLTYNYGPTPLPTMSQERIVSSRTRGIFISPVFAKASEPTSGGILFAGAHLYVNYSWLTIIPLSLVIILLRRRRKFIIKHLTYLLEVIL